MNTCEKKELKCVLQKLSNKLEGKMVGGATTPTIKSSVPSDFLIVGPNLSILPTGIVGLPFSFTYKKVKYSYFFNLVLPDNDYETFYKNTIKSITFSTTKLTIKSSTMKKTYDFSGMTSYNGNLVAYSILIKNNQYQAVNIFQNNNPYKTFPSNINVIINIKK